MIKRATLFFILPLLLLYPSIASASNHLTKKDRIATAEVVKRERTLLNAKVKSDWQTIYSLFAPHLRKQITLEEYIFQPHIPDGIVVLPSGKAPKKEEALKKKYQPTHIAYNITSVHLTKERNFAKVVADATIPLPPNIGPITINPTQEEYWSKIDGEWYLEWDLRYIVNISGAREKAKKLIPPFKYDINLAKLAGWYLQKIKELPAQKDALIEKALVLSPYFTALEISAKKIAGRQRALKAITYALVGREINKGLFTSEMEAGRWYTIVGDYPNAYRHYRMASQIDGYRVDAIERLFITAIAMKDYNSASIHLDKLLALSSILSIDQTKKITLLINENCDFCRTVEKGNLLKLARRFVYSENWKPAVVLYKYLLTLNPDYKKTVKKLLQGKKVKLKKALGKDLYKKFGNFTYYEIGEVLKNSGQSFYHPSELPKGRKTALTIKSIPRLFQATYQGGYNTTYLPAIGSIKESQTVSRRDEGMGGYLALFIGGSPRPISYYQDSDKEIAGSEALIKEINNLPKDSMAYLSRIATVSSPLSKAFKKSLSQAGFKSKIFEKMLSSHIIVLNKKDSSIRVWEGKEKMKKVFLPSNLNDVDKNSFTLTGRAGEEKIKFKR